jgi:DNA-binding XRE family transcriptional regulator
MGKRSGFPRLATDRGALVDTSVGRSALDKGRRGVKPHQKVNRDLGRSTFVVLEGLADTGPVLSRDAPPLPPFLNPPQGLANGFGKINGPAKALKQNSDIGDFVGLGSIHSHFVSSDNESGQCRTDWAMTSPAPKRTMCPMGRATTPTKFKADFCRRLRAARILANMSQGEAADALRVKEDTYSKYERRSPMPHYLIPKACELFRVLPNDLFGFTARADLDADYEEIRRAG